MTRSLIDGILPDADYAETQETWVPVSAGKAFRVFGEVLPSDVPELKSLGRRLGLEGDRPLYAQLLDSGFVVLTSDPLREVVVGRVAPLWRLIDRKPLIKGRRDFVRFGVAGHLKAALSVRLAADGDGTRVTVELRLRATDPALRWISRFVARGAGPLVERVTRGWLKAVARRAARLAVNPSSDPTVLSSK
jgi:hypothetical protein